MIEKVTEKNFDEALPLIREYQEFYKVDNINDDKNRAFFSSFLGANENGVLHLLRYEGRAVGFSTIYRSFSSCSAEATALLNDLYVQSKYRGKSLGRALLVHAQNEAKSMGYARLVWQTAQDNVAAQKLYDKLGANKSLWFSYSLKT